MKSNENLSIFHFLAFDFCLFCVVILFFHPRHNSQWPPTSKDFYTRSYPLHYFLILILEKEPVLPFSMLSAKLLSTIFITSLWWRGPWLGIEPGITRTRCQHSTTRLSRRRLISLWTFYRFHPSIFSINKVCTRRL